MDFCFHSGEDSNPLMIHEDLQMSCLAWSHSPNAIAKSRFSILLKRSFQHSVWLAGQSFDALLLPVVQIFRRKFLSPCQQALATLPSAKLT